MASSVPKIRLVRCPKCFKLLPELENLPVYHCGGCGIILEAKKRREDPKTEQKRDSEDNDSASSSQRALTYSTDSYEQDDYPDFSKDKSADRRDSNGFGSSGEINWHEKEESSSVAGSSRKENGNHERGRDLGSLIHDRRRISGRSNFTSATQKSNVKSAPSKPSSSTSSEEVDPSEMIVRRYADLIGSKGPLKSPRSSIISKPPATKNYHVNEAKGSPNVVLKNQVSDHPAKEHGSGSQRVEKLSSSNKGLIVEDISVDNKIDTESEVQKQGKKLLLMSMNENQSPSDLGNVSLDQDELPKIREILQVHDDNDMVENSFSEPSGAKIPQEYEGSVSSDEGASVSDLHSHHSKESFSGSESVDKLIATKDKPIMEDVSIVNRIDTKPEDRKHVPIILDSVCLQEDELPQNAECSNQVKDDHSVSSNDAWEDYGSDLHSEPPKKFFSESQMIGEHIDTDKKSMEIMTVNNRTDTESDIPSPTMNGKHVPVVQDSVILQEDELPENTECGIQVQDDSITSEDEMVYDKIADDVGVSNSSAIKGLHVYDASVSSNNGWGDKESFSESQRVVDNGAIREKDSSENNMINKETNLRHPARKFSLTSVIENHSMHHQEDLPQYTSYNFQVQDQIHSNFSSFKSTQTSFKSTQSWLGVERERLQSQKFTTKRYPPAGYEVNASSTHNNYPQQKLDRVERKQLEILRKVEQLSAELNRSYGHNTRGRPAPYGPSKVMPFQCSYHQRPNCLCSYASNEWQSLQRSPPPPTRYYSDNLGRGYTDHASYSLYSSDRSTPERNIQSRCPLRDGCILSHDEVQVAEPRERRPKRHYRPIAGGAPFITCYSCKNLLFLPADSFLSSKRLHRLQCGSCSKVLTFSLHGGSHVSPFSQNQLITTQGDVASSRGSTSTRNSVFRPHPIDNEGDPLSYSEDLELSIRGSDSISTDQSRSVDKRQQYGRVLKQKIKNRAKPKSSTQASISGSPSYNEAESSREGENLALHRLMGYSTVSRLLRAPSS